MRFALFIAISLAIVPATTQGQFVIDGELSSTVNLAESKNTSRVFQRVEALLKAEKWEEAVEMLRGQIDREAGSLIPMHESTADGFGFSLWVAVARRCQRELVSLHTRAPEALAIYRQRVDPLAKQWYEEGAARRNEKLLKRIVERMFASSYGDDALAALGEIYLEQGRFNDARDMWERLSPNTRIANYWSPAGMSIHQAANVYLEPSTETLPLNWLAYPDGDLPMAEIVARLTLVSILEGSFERANVELAWLEKHHPDATGKLAEKEGRWTTLLKNLLKETASIDPSLHDNQWITFAGNGQRSGSGEVAAIPVGKPAWRMTMPLETALGDRLNVLGRRVAETKEGLLSYHPVVVNTAKHGPLLFAVDRTRLYATRLADGSSQYIDKPATSPPTPFFDMQATAKTDEVEEVDDGDFNRVFSKNRPFVGVPRFTLNTFGDLLVARIGAPITGNREPRLAAFQRSRVMVFEFGASFKLLGDWRPESDRWAFDGTPLTDGSRIYFAMRETEPEDARVNLHVACFDIASGRRIWRRLVCGARSLSGGIADEITHTLLTQEDKTLFINTNLGAVAAIDMNDGDIEWLVKYPRAPFPPNDPDSSGQSFRRDLNPCLIAGGVLVVAPADCDRLFAVEAATGRLLWETRELRYADVVHLLGVAGNSLIASGDYLYWIDIHTGKPQCQFPEKQNDGPRASRPDPSGYGRGVLADGRIFWPTREQIFVFEQQPVKTKNRLQPKGVREISLADRYEEGDIANRRRASGGNLILAGEKFIIARPDEIVAYDTEPLTDPDESK